jgi:hypothetical protein
MILCHGCPCRESRPRLWPAGLLSRPSGRDDHRSCACGSYPGHYAGRCGVAAVAACGEVEDRGDPGPAPPDQRAAASAAAAAEAGLGGPALLGVIPKARRRGLRLLVTRDTILRWHRDIVRRRWAAWSAHGKTGRPATPRNIKALVRRLARENPGWDTAGSTARWLAWAPASQHRPSGRSSRPAASARPGRAGRNWSQFLRSQAEAILAWASSRPACPIAPRPMSWP